MRPVIWAARLQIPERREGPGVKAVGIRHHAEMLETQKPSEEFFVAALTWRMCDS